MSDAKRNTLLLILSFAAGCVDALAFVHTTAFPANMTGNSVIIALALLDRNVGGFDGLAVTLPMIALVGYCIGAAAGSWLVCPPGKDPAWSPRVSLTFLLAGLLLLGCAASLWIFGRGDTAPLIVFTAMAMGMQSAAVLRLGVAGVATVVVTGTLTSAITGFVGKAFGRRDLKGGPLFSSLIWLAYFTGAFAGGMQSHFGLDWIFALPGLLLASVAVAGFFKAKSQA
jgi:uncharacterized membrane protein YoaK (UPF0700 family)